MAEEFEGVLCPGCGTLNEGVWVLDVTERYYLVASQSGDYDEYEGDDEVTTKYGTLMHEDCGFEYEIDEECEFNCYAPTPKDLFWVRGEVDDENKVVRVFECGDYYDSNPTKLLEVLEDVYPGYDIKICED